VLALDAAISTTQYGISSNTSRLDVVDKPLRVRLSHTVDDIIVGYLSVWSPASGGYFDMTSIAAPPEAWLCLLWQLRSLIIVENEELVWSI
jgi:hypothetical protein